MRSIIPRRTNVPERIPVENRFWDPFETMREVLRWDPFRDVEQLVRPVPIAWNPAFDVKETKDAFVFRADLPGMKEEDLDISITGNRLTVTGKREEEKRDENDRWFSYERAYGTFTRTFTIPEGVDIDHIAAEMKDGVLAMTLPKLPEVQPKRIELKRHTVKA
jgi:HSP20 family protein